MLPQCGRQPGWRKPYNPLAQALNHEHGWARPEDPDRRRITTPQFYGKGAEGRDAINAAMRQHFADGLLQSRQDVVTALEDMGLDVVRQGKDYMTARGGIVPRVHRPAGRGLPWAIHMRCVKCLGSIDFRSGPNRPIS